MCQQWSSTSRRKQQKIPRFKKQSSSSTGFLFVVDWGFSSDQAKVDAEDLEAWVSQHGPLPSKCLVLMRFRITHHTSHLHSTDVHGSSHTILLQHWIKSGWGNFYNSDPPKFMGIGQSKCKYILPFSKFNFGHVIHPNNAISDGCSTVVL